MDKLDIFEQNGSNYVGIASFRHYQTAGADVEAAPNIVFRSYEQRTGLKSFGLRKYRLVVAVGHYWKNTRLECALIWYFIFLPAVASIVNI